MRIIVTGGAGFIGSSIVWRLNQLGHEDLLIVDRMDETDKWKNLAPLQFADYIDADDFIDDLADFKEVETIFHMGACSSTTETDADYMLHNNYQYTKDLADFAVANEIRFIYASSAATYGDGSAGMDDGTESLNDLRPLNVYGYSKHLFDQYAARSGIFDKIVGLKYFNVFGPRQNPSSQYSGVISRFIDALMKGEKPVIYGDGEQTRDFTYIANVVNANIKAATSPSCIGETMNAANGERVSLNELLETLKRITSTENVQAEFLEERKGDVKHSQADNSKARELIGYEKLVGLEEGLRHTIEWWKKSRFAK